MIAVEQESVFRECCQLYQLDFLLAQVVVTPANVEVTLEIRQKQSRVQSHSHWADITVKRHQAHAASWKFVRIFGKPHEETFLFVFTSL